MDAAEIMSAYSRAEALADGTLVDVTATAHETGFKSPVAHPGPHVPVRHGDLAGSRPRCAGCGGAGRLPNLNFGR